MPATSLARSFFDSIVNSDDPVAVIRELVNASDPTFEADWLDFKTEHRDPKRNDPKIREAKYKEQLLEAISGFGNNSGGVLIWGIRADKPKDGPQIDAANEEVPVSDPKAVKSRLMQLRGMATDPPLPNVEIEAYEHPDKPDTGFVVCFVPEGEFKPYRTNDGKSSQFYIRAGDTFSVMSRSVIHAMFYPRSYARFRIKLELKRILMLDPNRASFSNDIVPIARWQLAIQNVGTATAREPVVRLSTSVEFHELNPAMHWPNDTRHPPSFRARISLHPGDEATIAGLEYRPKRLADGKLPETSLKFALSIYCENQEPQVVQIEQNLDGDWKRPEEVIPEETFGFTTGIEELSGPT